MLYTIAAILVILWLAGLFLHLFGGLIHILLVLALIFVVINFFTGRK
jgi:hypothetical protein